MIFMQTLKTVLAVLASLCILLIIEPKLGVPVAHGSSSYVRIFGFVDRDLNLTYADLLSFPMVSEVANLKCVAGLPDVTYNWTGVPLFHLLTLAGIKPQAYKVVTRGSDGFESDLLVEDALQPTTILALGANGTGLPEIGGIQGLFRLVVPCKWGYKWVGDVQEIEVVDYDYKGTYESSGWPDDASRPDCGPSPQITPQVQVFPLVFGNRTFTVEAFTNASISAFRFNYLQNEVDLNVTVPTGTSGFTDVILDQNFLKGPYTVFTNEKAANVTEANVTERSFIYIPFSESFETVRIVGTEFFGRIPAITVEYDQIAYVGEETAFNASRSVDEGQIVSYQWSFGDGATGNGAVVSHTYVKEGIYEVKVNVTDNEDLSSLKTISVTVEVAPGLIPSIAKPLLAILAGLLIFMFVLLLLRRKPRTVKVNSQPQHNSVSAALYFSCPQPRPRVWHVSSEKKKTLKRLVFCTVTYHIHLDKLHARLIGTCFNSSAYDRAFTNRE
jgi:PKD repeat protein